MESSGPSGKTSEPHSIKWGDFLGTVIALITLILPLMVISHYSENNHLDTLPKAAYSSIKVQE